MTRRARRRRANSEAADGNLRTAVLERAVARVAERGADGLSVAEIARELSVSTAAPYRHFADRTALLHAVGAEGMNRLGTAMASAAAQQRPGGDRLVAIGHAYLDFARDEPHLFRTMFGTGESAKPSPDADRLRHAGHAAFAVLRAEVATALGDAGESSRATGVAFALWSFVHGQAMLILDRRDGVVGSELDRDALMHDVTARLLAPPPAG